MARAARERAQMFAWRQVAAEILDTYEDALSPRCEPCPRREARRPNCVASSSERDAVVDCAVS